MRTALQRTGAAVRFATNDAIGVVAELLGPALAGVAEMLDGELLERDEAVLFELRVAAHVHLNARTSVAARRATSSHRP